MTIQIGKMIIAWLLANVTVVVAHAFWNRQGATRLLDGLLGVGLIVGLPMLLFALVIALPLALLVQRIAPPIGGLLIYPFLVAGIAWLITSPLFPDSWKGAQQAICLFAFVLGVSWSLLGVFIAAPANVT